MKSIGLGLLGVAFIAGCGDAKDHIPAGEVARALGVRHYQIERFDGGRIIRIFAEHEGQEPIWIGEIELTSLRVGDIGWNGEPMTEWDLASGPIFGAQLRNPYKNERLGTFAGKERFNPSCPRDLGPARVAPNNAYLATLVDPNLAPFLAELDLYIETWEQPDNFVRAEVPFDGYPHVGNCNGHKVNAHTSGANYVGCWQEGDKQYMENTWYGTWATEIWVASRTAWGGSGSPNFGNGQGGTNCCNGSCEHPSPSGTSSQNDCGGFSANGTKNATEYSYSCESVQCFDTCWNGCHNYDEGCC